MGGGEVRKPSWWLDWLQRCQALWAVLPEGARAVLVGGGTTGIGRVFVGWVSELDPIQIWAYSVGAGAFAAIGYAGWHSVRRHQQAPGRLAPASDALRRGERPDRVAEMRRSDGVSMAWKHTNCAEFRVKNDTDDNLVNVVVVVTGMVRRLKTGKWFPAEVERRSPPFRLRHSGVTIRPERYADFPFIQTHNVDALHGTFAGDRDSVEDYFLREKGHYKALLSVTWDGGGELRFEAPFVWERGKPPLPDGEIFAGSMVDSGRVTGGH